MEVCLIYLLSFEFLPIAKAMCCNFNFMCFDFNFCAGAGPHGWRMSGLDMCGLDPEMAPFPVAGWRGARYPIVVTPLGVTHSGGLGLTPLRISHHEALRAHKRYVFRYNSHVLSLCSYFLSCSLPFPPHLAPFQHHRMKVRGAHPQLILWPR